MSPLRFTRGIYPDDFYISVPIDIQDNDFGLQDDLIIQISLLINPGDVLALNGITLGGEIFANQTYQNANVTIQDDDGNY